MGVRTIVATSPHCQLRWGPMIDERALRRPNYVEGKGIRLANGQVWSFPERPPLQDDHELIAVLREIGESEDEPDQLRAELTLAILLLSRNYDLTPADYQAILGFDPGDPALEEMQRGVDEIAM